MEKTLFQIRIEKMDPTDLDEVLAIEAPSSLTPWSKAMFVDEMSNPLSYCFVAAEKRQPGRVIVGFLCFRMIQDESELLSISVHPRHRRLGIGKKLMGFYIDFCTKKRIRRAYLEVSTLNQTAIHLYQRHSFQPVGMRKRFYRQQFDALLMMKQISPLTGC